MMIKKKKKHRATFVHWSTPKGKYGISFTFIAVFDMLSQNNTDS